MLLFFSNEDLGQLRGVAAYESELYLQCRLQLVLRKSLKHSDRRVGNMAMVAHVSSEALLSKQGVEDISTLYRVSKVRS